MMQMTKLSLNDGHAAFQGWTITLCMSMEGKEEGNKGGWGREETESAGVRQNSKIPLFQIVKCCLKNDELNIAKNYLAWCAASETDLRFLTALTRSYLEYNCDTILSASHRRCWNILLVIESSPCHPNRINYSIFIKSNIYK